MTEELIENWLKQKLKERLKSNKPRRIVTTAKFNIDDNSTVRKDHTLQADYTGCYLDGNKQAVGYVIDGYDVTWEELVEYTKANHPEKLKELKEVKEIYEKILNKDKKN